MPIEGADYFVYIKKFPVPIPAVCRLNADGTYSLFVNEDYVTDRCRLVDIWEHEYWHMLRDDLYGDKDIREVERM